MPYLTDAFIHVHIIWNKCTPEEKIELKELVMNEFELPLLGLGLPLDESVVEYMIESHGEDVMTAEMKDFVKKEIQELIWKVEHKKTHKMVSVNDLRV